MMWSEDQSCRSVCARVYVCSVVSSVNCLTHQWGRYEDKVISDHIWTENPSAGLHSKRINVRHSLTRTFYRTRSLLKGEEQEEEKKEERVLVLLERKLHSPPSSRRSFTQAESRDAPRVRPLVCFPNFRTRVPRRKRSALHKCRN